MLSVSSRSRMKLGNGTSITNTRATAPVGMNQSEMLRSVSAIQTSCSLRPHCGLTWCICAAALCCASRFLTSSCAL